MRWAAAFVLLAAISCSIRAETYKCVDKGRVLLTDQPCLSAADKTSKKAEEVKTAAQIQAEFDREVSAKKAAEKQQMEDRDREDKARLERIRKQEALIKYNTERAPIIAIRATRVLRRAMRDPDSLSVESAKVSTESGSVCFVYRAKNGFGGMTMGQSIVLADEYTVLDSKADGFYPLWTSDCIGKKAIETER